MRNAAGKPSNGIRALGRPVARSQASLRLWRVYAATQAPEQKLRRTSALRIHLGQHFVVVPTTANNDGGARKAVERGRLAAECARTKAQSMSSSGGPLRTLCNVGCMLLCLAERVRHHTRHGISTASRQHLVSPHPSPRGASLSRTSPLQRPGKPVAPPATRAGGPGTVGDAMRVDAGVGARRGARSRLLLLTTGALAASVLSLRPRPSPDSGGRAMGTERRNLVSVRAGGRAESRGSGRVQHQPTPLLERSPTARNTPTARHGAEVLRSGRKDTVCHVQMCARGACLAFAAVRLAAYRTGYGHTQTLTCRTVSGHGWFHR